MDTIRAYVILLFTVFIPETVVDATIYTYDSTNETHVFEDMPSTFGSGIAEDGILGILIRAEPYNACSKIDHPPYSQNAEENVTIPQIALIVRGGCDFAIKVFHAQNAGFRAAIVHNVGSNSLVKMGSDLPSITNKIYIPSVFVGESTAVELNSTFLYEDIGSPYIQIYEGAYDPLRSYIVPFIIVLAICIVLILCLMFTRWIRDHRRTRRNRLSLRKLKNLPVKKYAKGDEYDACAICLDDYEEEDSLRILPCSHAYHCKCVDPWLTSNKRVCPLCKRRVLSDDEGGSSSNDNDDDTSDDERTPLVPSSVAASPNAPMYATGYGSRNPFNRSRRQIDDGRVSTSTESTDASDAELVPERSFPRRTKVAGARRKEPSAASGSQTQASQPQLRSLASNDVGAVSASPDTQLNSAEAMMVEPDAETLGFAPKPASCSSRDFCGLDESTAVTRPPSSLQPGMCATPDSGQEDVVIALGSRAQIRGDGEEV